MIMTTMSIIAIIIMMTAVAAVITMRNTADVHCC